VHDDDDDLENPIHRRGAENAEVSQRRGEEKRGDFFTSSPLRDLSVLCASAVKNH